jgi:hypothetical protein
MWIRSQDDRCLIKAYHIRINGFSIEVIQPYCCSLIAKYSTKGKALKVLDIIQDRLINDCDFYQMPRDDEVEGYGEQEIEVEDDESKN